jgi:hypothetical protein
VRLIRCRDDSNRRADLEIANAPRSATKLHRQINSTVALTQHSRLGRHCVHVPLPGWSGMMQRMTLEQLRVFIAVAERQHVTRAAAAINLAHSAASATIAALEAQYGTKLFHLVQHAERHRSKAADALLSMVAALSARSRKF